MHAVLFFQKSQGQCCKQNNPRKLGQPVGWDSLTCSFRVALAFRVSVSHLKWFGEQIFMYFSQERGPQVNCGGEKNIQSKQVKSIVVKDAFILQKFRSNKNYETILFDRLITEATREKKEHMKCFLSLTICEVDTTQRFYRNHFTVENVAAFLKPSDAPGSPESSGFPSECPAIKVQH